MSLEILKKIRRGYQSNRPRFEPVLWSRYQEARSVRTWNGFITCACAVHYSTAVHTGRITDIYTHLAYA